MTANQNIELFPRIYETDSHGIKIHLGCGNERWDGYINIDISSESKADIIMNYLDIDTRFEPSSISEIVMIQSFNYMTLWEAREFIAKSYSLLAPG
jgi:predicted SAM-dependent methyltransferase